MKEVVTPKAIELKKNGLHCPRSTGQGDTFYGFSCVRRKGKLVRVIANITGFNRVKLLEKATYRIRLEVALYHDELARLKTQMSTDGIIFVSAELQKVLDLALRVAPVDTTVLITGESGVGKEVIAKIIYETSKRSKALYKDKLRALYPPR